MIGMIANWNVTTWFLIAQLFTVIAWELIVILLNRNDLTITTTIRSWSPQIILVLGITLIILVWHIWIYKGE